MKRAILDLEQLADNALFEVLSEGMPLIVENAVSLDDIACGLYKDKKYCVSEVIRGFAEEEAAKVMILIDYVRCPRNSKQRGQILRRFYQHVPKRVHAMACEYSSIASFGELSELVEGECRPWYLDGPNQVDWIFQNSILEKREHGLYVDYVQDVTDTKGGYHWKSPSQKIHFFSQYKTSDCVRLAQALSRAGAASGGGLAEIADVWRSFEPVPETHYRKLRDLIVETLGRLIPRCGDADEADVRFIVSHWPFPLWPLTIKDPRPTDGDLDGLREKRKRTVERIERIEAKREPAPAISRAKVEALNDAHAAWEKDIEAHASYSGGNEHGGLRIRSLDDMSRDFELASYKHLEDMVDALSDEERAALLALGWFAREQIADWPRIHKRAIEEAPSTDQDYLIRLGSYWLAGLDRWEAKPQPFEAGQSRVVI